MNDERKGLPSASGIHRLAACPGSLRMCAGLPDTSTPESESGTRIHAHLSLQGEGLRDMTDQEKDIAESCIEIELRLVMEWRKRHQIPEDVDLHPIRDEQRLWLRTESDRPLCSGVADVMYLWNYHALVLDFKTFAGGHADASENAQLRTLAVLVSEYYSIETIEVAIIQPLVTHSPTVCAYGRPELAIAKAELLAILREAAKPSAPLNPGEHCKYCRAASICPAVRKEVETLSALTINASGLTVPDEDMAALLQRCGPAAKMIASIKAECFRRAEADPDRWRAMGYEIREGVGKRAVEDIATVSERLNAQGVPWRDITKHCTITIGNVEKLSRQATGAKGMQLKRETDAVLDGCVTIRKAKPSLKRIGANLEDGEDE